jgi:hypothetical protein
MRTLKIASLASFASAAALSLSALAASKSDDHNVNAYGERAGISNPPEIALADPSDFTPDKCPPGTVVWYQFPGSTELPSSLPWRKGESLGQWQTRAAAASANATVTIGTLQVLDSGPTGPMTPEARDAARQEVTTDVLNRIAVTDRVMAALKQRASNLDANTQAQFKTVASEVRERRQALRESLKAVRTADDAQWSDARSAVAVNYNAYAQSLRHAQESVGLTPNV